MPFLHWILKFEEEKSCKDKSAFYYSHFIYIYNSSSIEKNVDYLSYSFHILYHYDYDCLNSKEI